MKFYSLLCIILLTSCTPQSQDFHPADTQGARLDAGVYLTTDEVVLPYRSWLPEKKVKAAIIALHGFNDYSLAFEGLGSYFQSHDVAVYAYDQRGFGGSADVGIWANEENLTGDLRHFIGLVQRAHPKAPIYILGESMGGAVAIDALADPTFPKVKGLILSAPAVWGAETMSPFYRGTLWLAAHTVPFKQFSGSDLKIIASNNYPMLIRMAHDPLIIKKTRVDSVYGLVHLMDNAYEKIPELQTPTLLLYGAKDQVIPPTPIHNAIMRFSQPVEYAYYPEGFHMLLRDLQSEEVMEDVLSWIRRPSAPLPSGYGKNRTPEQSDPLVLSVD